MIQARPIRTEEDLELLREGLRSIDARSTRAVANEVQAAVLDGRHRGSILDASGTAIGSLVTHVDRSTGTFVVKALHCSRMLKRSERMVICEMLKQMAEDAGCEHMAFYTERPGLAKRVLDAGVLAVEPIGTQYYMMEA